MVVVDAEFVIRKTVIAPGPGVRLLVPLMGAATAPGGVGVDDRAVGGRARIAMVEVSGIGDGGSAVTVGLAGGETVGGIGVAIAAMIAPVDGLGIGLPGAHAQPAIIQQSGKKIAVSRLIPSIPSARSTTVWRFDESKSALFTPCQQRQ